MSWFKVDDLFHSHPKVHAVSLRASGLWVRAGSWSSAQGTGGRVPLKTVRALGGTRRDAGELVRAGLWVEDSPDAWVFHDWGHYQPTGTPGATPAVPAQRPPGQRPTPAGRSAGALATNHTRWHVARGVVDPGCPLCPDVAPQDRGTAQDTLREPVEQSQCESLSDGSESLKRVAQDRSASRSRSLPEVASPPPTDSLTDREATRSATRITVAPGTPEPAGGGGGRSTHEDGTPAGGQGRGRANALLADLAGRGLSRNGWTTSDDTEAERLVALHGRERLAQTALSRPTPNTLRGALHRWRALPAPRSATPDVRCREHHQTHPATSECPGCRADRLLDATAVPDEPELTDEQAERASAVLRRIGGSARPTRGAA